jgi:hypothetical protein
MHPGPINRGVEIDSAVVDGPQAVILSQVTFGIAVRMAVMSSSRGTRLEHPEPLRGFLRDAEGTTPSLEAALARRPRWSAPVFDRIFL